MNNLPDIMGLGQKKTGAVAHETFHKMDQATGGKLEFAHGLFGHHHEHDHGNKLVIPETEENKEASISARSRSGSPQKRGINKSAKKMPNYMKPIGH